MSHSKITNSFQLEFQKLLDLKNVKANEHFQLLTTCLRKHNLVYTVEKANPKFFLTHFSNRGGLLLSPHNVHRNAGRIHKCGADIRQLNNAFCIELATNGKVREEHLKKNEMLILRSGGLLAPINGLERFVSLGAGHTVAFCKLAGVSGRTSEKELQCVDSDTIDVQKLCRNKEFEIMVVEGWTWECVPSIIDELFPAFAIIAQRALNTQNHISTEVGELETCMTLAASADDPGMKELESWKELAVANVASLCVPCAKYSKTLLEFVLKFGGGTGAPFISFMDAVAKGFGCNVNLGQSFWEAVTTTTFPAKTCMFPLDRVALCLANLTSDKVEDGVARLLGKGDVTRLATKSKLAELTTAEELLQHALDIGNTLGGIEQVLKPMGKVFVRVGLLLTSKEKQGREHTVYTVAEIQQKFLTELGEVVGKTIAFPEWAIDGAAAVVEPKPTASTSIQPSAASLANHNDPVWIASQSGFAVGKIVMEKDVEASPEKLFTIFAIAKMVAIKQVCCYSGKPFHTEVTLQDLLDKWVTSKADPPMQMQGGQRRPKSLEVDKNKAVIFKAVMDLDAKHVNKHALTFWRRPDFVFTAGTIKEGALVLVPVVPMMSITTKNSSSGTGISFGQHSVDDKKVEFFALPVAKPQKEDVKVGDDVVMAAFWWVISSVNTTTDRKLANMALETITQNGVAVPVLKNIIELPPRTKLCLLVKPKAKAAPVKSILENAVTKAPPLKKPRLD